MDPMDSAEREDLSSATPGADVKSAPDSSEQAPEERAPEEMASHADATNGVTPEAASEASAASASPEADPSADALLETVPRMPAASLPGYSDNGAPAPDPRDFDDLAVTAPLKSRRGGAAALAASLAAAVVEGADGAPPEREPLAPGDVLAGYTIERLLRAGDSGPVYLMTPPAPDAEAPVEIEGQNGLEGQEPPAWRYIAREVSADEAERLERVVAAGARGPGLLAPVAFAREQGRAYVIGVEAPGSGDKRDQPATPLGANERLRPVDALTACTQLATALAALHHAGLTHLHISPDQVTLFDGRVYLGGIEGATPVSDPEEGADLYARDANFLARTVGALGGASDVTLWDHDSSAQRSLREIAMRGASGSYATADEVAEAGSLGLQMLMVAGARMGADVRAVRLRLEWGAMSSVGRVRSENQDAWSATQFAVNDDAAADAPLGVFLVADGMGGEAHGEIASRVVARVVSAEMARRFLEPQAAWPALAVFTAAEEDATSAPQVPLTVALEQAVKEANRRTRDFSQRINATTGSTVTALAVAGARAALAHLGDSRAYLLRDGQLLQLTEDHSLLARLEAMKHPALEDPSFMAPRSVLYRSIGQEDDVTPDLLQFVLAPGDRIMMCSDGLWDELTREQIAATMAGADDPQTCASALVTLANIGGGHDNSTAVALFVHANPADLPFESIELEEINAAARDALAEEESPAEDSEGDDYAPPAEQAPESEPTVEDTGA